MEKFFNSTKQFIFTKQKDILSSVIALAIMILASRIFGFLRYRTLATFFSKEELDLFFASFRLPDFVFEIVITGALTSAFIPIFVKYEKNKEELEYNISSIINFMLILMLGTVVVLFFLTPLITPFIIPGIHSPQVIAQVVHFSQIILVSQLPLLVMGNILSGMAQANKMFIVTAIAPVFYNLGIILGTVFFTERFWMYGPIIGVIIGAALFFLIQTPTIVIINFNYRLRFFKKSTLKEFSSLFVPRVLSVITTQIDLTIDLILSTFLGAGSYTIFFFAQHLQLFPVSMIGMAFGQASLPYFSDLYKNKQFNELKIIFVDSLLQILFFTVPISFFFIFMRTPIVRFFFGGAKFDWEGTVQTAHTLSYFAVSLPLHAIFYLIIRSFYATHNTKIPLFINLISVGINTALSLVFIFIFKLPIWSLALSFSIAITLNVLFLLICFDRRINGFSWRRLVGHGMKIYVASISASLIGYPLMKLLDKLVLDTTRTINVAFLIGIVAIIFSLIYLFMAWLLTIEEIYLIGRLMLKFKEA